MKPIVEAGHVPTIAPMGNMPVLKDLVVDMAPFWDKIRAMKPWLDPGYDEVAEKERIVSQQQMNAIHKERSASCAAAASRSATRWSPTRSSSGRRRSPRAIRFVGDPRDQAESQRLERVQPGARDLGLHALLFLQRALPEGRRPARRDRQARRGVDQAEGIDHDMGAKHAKWFVKSAETTGWLRETELVPKTQGSSKRSSRAASRSSWPSTARCRRRSRRTWRRTSMRRGRCATSCASRAATARPGSSRARGRLATDRARARGRRRALRRQEWRRLSRSASRTTRAASPRSRRRSSTSRRRRSRRSSGWSSTSSSRSPAAAPATSTRPSPTTTCT